jgi:hypothetical protein
VSDFRISEEAGGLWIIARGFGPETAVGDAEPAAAREARAVAEDVRHFVLRGIHDEDSTFPFVIRSYLSLPASVLFNAILFANQKLNRRNRKLAIHDRVAVSVVIAFREGSRVALANVGVGRATKLPEARPLVLPRSYASYLPQAERQSLFADIPLVSLGMGKDDFEPEIVEYRLGPGEEVALGMGDTEEFLKIA